MNKKIDEKEHIERRDSYCVPEGSRNKEFLMG